MTTTSAPKCHRGHVKKRRRYGWYCTECEKLTRHAREEQAFLDGRRARRINEPLSRSEPTDLVCKKGHPRVRRPGGALACPTCQNDHKNARRRLAKSKTCPHAEDEGFQGIVSELGTMVCLACLVAEMDAA